MWEGMILRKIENRGGGFRSEGGPSYDILYYKDDQADNTRTARPYEGVFPVPPRFGRTLGYCVTPARAGKCLPSDCKSAKGGLPEWALNCGTTFYVEWPLPLYLSSALAESNREVAN